MFNSNNQELRQPNFRSRIPDIAENAVITENISSSDSEKTSEFASPYILYEKGEPLMPPLSEKTPITPVRL